MKKIISLLLTLLLALLLTGCGTPAEHYADAVSNFNKATGVTCNFEAKFTFTDENGSYGATATGKLLINNGEKSVASLKGTGVLSPADGTRMTADLSAYYDGNKYYAGIGTTGICYSATWAEALAEIGQYSFAANLTETDFEGILSEETEEGEIITYVVPAKNASAYEGVERLWKRVSGKGTAQITSIQGKLTLDKDRNPLIQEITVSGTLTDGATTLVVSQEVKTTIGLSEEAVPVESPAAGNFTEIK